MSQFEKKKDKLERQEIEQNKDEQDSNQEIKGEELQQKYLSSYNLDIFKNENENLKDSNPTVSQQVLIAIELIIKSMISYTYFLIYPFFMALMGFIMIIVIIFDKCRGRSFLQYLWVFICCSCYAYSVINFVFFPVENQNIIYFQLDGLLFYFSSILVFSYLKANYYKEDSILNTLRNMWDVRSVTTLQYQGDAYADSKAYFIDYREYSELKIQNEMLLKGQSQISNLFSFFLDNTVSINSPQRSIQLLISEFEQFFFPNFKLFFILSGILILKLSFCFRFIFLQESNITQKDQLDMIVMIFLYIYTTFNLNRILGNNDLRRKYAFMVAQNNYIDFRDISTINLNTKIDITCPITLESWDNTRKITLTLQNDWLETLELSYFCLFIYFIIVTLVCFSSYFELFWIFEKHSVLQEPIIVIMSSFNFIFLTAFFLIRFYQGGRFNSTFDDLIDSISHLLDTTTDLQTIFDYHFDNDFFKNIPKQEQKRSDDEKQDNSGEQEQKEYKNNIYAILVKKIKLQSFYYINNKVKYQGKIYKKNEKDKLRKKMIINTKIAIEKIKMSLHSDQINHKYKFLNLVEVNFEDTLLTLLFSLVTTLPTIIPKFIEFYHHKGTEQEHLKY